MIGSASTEAVRRAADRAVLDGDTPCALGPPEAFSDQLAPTHYLAWWPSHTPGRFGPSSDAVARRITSSCAGWRRRPTSQEFYDAVRAPKLTNRQFCLISMWVCEATTLDLLDAWGEHVYTWRMLVAAIHRAGPLRAYRRFREINRMALVPEFQGISLWTD